jgi:hypothetical protein
MTEKHVERQVTIAGQPYVLRSDDVARAMEALDPEPIKSHYVVVGSRRFPPKQVLSELTGLDRADFTTHQARRTLVRLGFSAGRRVRSAATAPGNNARPSAAAHDRLADRLRPLAGRWVAIRDQDILHDAHSPHALVAWLSEHGQRADRMFRVPENEAAATGLAPL